MSPLPSLLRALALLMFAACWTPAQAAEPAPAEAADWRDQILYFLMIDRFEDGDPGNNDQGAGEYDPADGRKFSGGDLAGVAQRLDYIQGLGATAIWITPPVSNQWWSDRAQFGGYHGYWARDFKAVDAHFGSVADYKRLADAMHGRGLRLVQDIVVNHTGDYFGWDAGYDPSRPQTGFALRRQSDGSTAPSQPPFDRNDVRKRGDRAAAIYHWTPQIRDFADLRQTLDWQLADLDDLNTETPVVRAALRDSYGFWIREVGVDAFRVDTAFYVPPAFFADFLHADDPRQPGVLKVAAAAGKPAFHLFGEGFGTDPAYEDAMARKIERYARGANGESLLPAMINFPLYGTLNDVFARGHPPGELGFRIDSMMRVHADPWRMPTFVDNHDVDRYLAGGDEAGLKQALLAIMTLPGIPTIYYGTEQGFREQRAAMFASGHGSGGRDRFDADASLYRYLQRIASLRREHRVFSRGTPTVLAANAAAPGAIAWRMTDDDQQALVVFNTATHATLLDRLDTGLPPGTKLQPLFGLAAEATPIALDARGRTTLVLPPRSALVWTSSKSGEETAATESSALAMDPAADIVADDLALSGTAPGRTSVRIVVDGDLDAAQIVAVGRDGRWRASVATDDMIDRDLVHRVLAWDPTTATTSDAHTFKVARAWSRVASVDDPTDDDTGPSGRYLYPDDSGWRMQRPGDLLGADVETSGGALRLTLKLRSIVADWNPLNGFDHVAFTAFFELPGRTGGATAMPQQNGTLPDGMRWQLRLRAHGWSNALFSAQGASADADGTVVAAAPRIAVDRTAKTVSFTFPARALGGGHLSGARIHITTWDYDGGYRALAPQATGNTFGGGDAEQPKTMDTLTLQLP
jgi:glycosidase